MAPSPLACVCLCVRVVLETDGGLNHFHLLNFVMPVQLVLRLAERVLTVSWRSDEFDAKN